MEVKILIGLVAVLAILLVKQTHPRHPYLHDYEEPLQSFWIIQRKNFARRFDAQNEPDWEEFMQSMRSLDPYAYIIAALILLYFLLRR